MPKLIVRLETDLYSNRPWAYSPLLATMNVVHITSDPPASQPSYSKLRRLNEDTFLTPIHGTSTQPTGPITSSSSRRKWLSSYYSRKSTRFPTTYIAGDFSNSFVDFNSFTVILPYVGLKLDVLKYWIKGNKRQPLRYVCRLRPKEGEDEVVFFVVLFELVGDGVVWHNQGLQAANGDISKGILREPSPD